MARAPPIVAGIPTRHSMPPRLMAAASRIRAERLTPAPAIASSPWSAARPRQPSSRRTTPRTPRSLTSKLLPPPITETGSCSRSANMSAWRMSSTSCGTTKMSAVPPMRSEVWKLRGSLNRTSPRISPSMWPSQSTSRVQALQQLRSELAHVAGAERDHEIAATDDLREVVTVVVDHGDCAGTTEDLKPALDSREAGQRSLDRRERDLEIETDADRREGVEHVVAARDLERDFPEQALALIDLEAAGHAREPPKSRDEIGARLEAVRDDPFLDPGNQELDVLLVEAEGHRRVE